MILLLLRESAFLLGLVLILVGIWFIYWPVSLIVAGLFLSFFVWITENGASSPESPDLVEDEN